MAGQSGDEAMYAKIARGAFLLTLAAMIVSWAVTVTESSPADPAPDSPVEILYS
jgi:hypothetical protein